MALELSIEQRHSLLCLLREELVRAAEDALAGGVPARRLAEILAERLRCIQDLGNLRGIREDGSGGGDDPPYHRRVAQES
jgi:hypothetical protein